MDQFSKLKSAGPRWRVDMAARELAHPGMPKSDDIWVRKLHSILELHQYYKKDLDSFNHDWPLFAVLLTIFKQDAPGCLRHLIEAALVGKADDKEVATLVKDFGITPEVVSVYRTLFYCLPGVLEPAWVATNLVMPAVAANGTKLACEHIWKLVAAKGGYERFVARCLEMQPFSEDDLHYLTELGVQRNLTMVLQYAADGFANEENRDTFIPVAQKIIVAMTTFASSRAPDGLEAKEEFTGLAGFSFDEIGEGMVSKHMDVLVLPPEVIANEGKFHPEQPESSEEVRVYNPTNNNSAEVAQ